MSDDDTKDWANIRIEEPVRDDAREYDETYTAIMRAGLEALYADLVAVRSDGTVELRAPDRPIEDAPTVDGIQDALGLPDEAIPNGLSEQLDRIEATAKEATSAAQSAENSVEELQR